MAKNRRQAAAKKQTPTKSEQAAESQQDDNQSTGVEQAESQGETRQPSEETQQEDTDIDAPEDLAQEESKLRNERQANVQALKDAFQDEDAELNPDRFKKLDELLSKADMYTQFVSEQLAAVDEFGDLEAVPVAKTSKGKRKAEGGQGGQPKKACPDTKTLLPLINGELRDYQLKGVKWLSSLYKNGMSGILADQMGLGKTIQTIGFISHLWKKTIYGPFIVIAPLSTLTNWEAEFQKFAPTVPVLLYHGNKQERQKMRSSKMTKRTKEFPVIITSFEIVLADAKVLSQHSWKLMVVDEGHRLKNYNCKLLRELRTLSVDSKVLLTGTPLQNNLGELWSLLNFLLPDLFKDLSLFESWFDFSSVGLDEGQAAIVAQEQRNHVVTKLHSILRPFLLRRIKGDVEADLPGKQEIVLYAPMAKEQRRINEQLRAGTLQEAANSIEKGLHGANIISRLNNVLMQMRKNCNHPDLITGGLDGSITYPSPEVLREQGGKLALLHRLVTHLHKNGHKIIIFSQMTKMLDVLHHFFEEQGFEASRIDGSISYQDRKAAVDTFNTDPERFIFLLSTRAGGLGINLTAADTCIIYDSDWNPHQDMQAMDRCHRIGQTKPVLVFRLATAHSVEGQLLRRANRKLALERLVIKRGAFMSDAAEDSKASGLGAEELLKLLESKESQSDKTQSGAVSDAMLKKLLNRQHLADHKPAPYDQAGVGYEIVIAESGTGMLSGVQ